jgi:hypothetical protein
MLSKKVRVVATFPDNTHPKIIYSVALVTGHDDVAAHAFYDYLTGPEAAAIFEKYGFIILHEKPITIRRFRLMSKHDGALASHRKPR